MNDVLSVYRNENKYLIPIVNMAEIKIKLESVLKEDKNSKGGSYIVRSLYFDSINNIDFYTKMAGTEIRKKIRIRVYDSDAKKCKLEMKKKNGDFGHKISLWITRDDVEDLVKGKYNALTKYFDKSKEAIEIYETMSLGCYRPVVMVEYERKAYTYPMYDTRITFDYNLRSSESNFDLFDKNINYNSILNDKVILEVKYNENIMNFITKILSPYKLTRISISKYCMSRKVYYDFNY